MLNTKVNKHLKQWSIAELVDLNLLLKTYINNEFEDASWVLNLGDAHTHVLDYFEALESAITNVILPKLREEIVRTDRAEGIEMLQEALRKLDASGLDVSAYQELLKGANN